MATAFEVVPGNNDGMRERSVRLSAASVSTHEEDEENRDKHFIMDALDFSSTYSALSSAVREYKRTGGRNLYFLPKDLLQRLYDKFREEKADLANLESFPQKAQDEEDCLLLLARIQNRGAVLTSEEKPYTLRDIIEGTLVDRKGKRHLYDIGEYVEVFGSGMKWRLEKISNVIKNDLKDTYVYQTVVDQYLTEDNMRWPKTALTKIFGFSPFIWQQWACLRLEHRLEFSAGSRYDFENFSIMDYTKDLWIVWLNDDRNKAFRNLYERVGESGQEQLLHHIMTPFESMQAVVTNKDDQWNLEESKISIFTYVSFLGSGVMDSLVVVSFQFIIPAFLAVFYWKSTENGGIVDAGTREVLCAVLLYYLFKVTRDGWNSFSVVVGISDEVYSKLQSLRKIVFDNGNDSTTQTLGYISDIFINTGYVSLMYLFNVWILFHVENAFEILGAVVFFEFLVDLDETFATSGWWDKKKRWLRAGIISQMMQQIIATDHTFTSRMYVERYGHHMRCLGMTNSDLVKLFDKAQLPNDESFLGSEESNHLIGVWTLEERLKYKRLSDTKSTRHLIKNHKEDTYFKFLSDSPIFQRHRRLRTWSQWQILLFLMPVPDLVPEDYNSGSKLVVGDRIGNVSLTTVREDPIGKTRNQRFWRDVKSGLTFGSLKQGYHNRRFIKNKPKIFFLTRFLYALTIWMAYIVQLFFPLLVVLALIAVYIRGPEGGYFYCYLRSNFDSNNTWTITNFWEKNMTKLSTV